MTFKRPSNLSTVSKRYKNLFLLIPGIYFSNKKKADNIKDDERITISIILIISTVLTLIKKALRNKKASPKTNKKIERMRNFLFLFFNSL